MSIHAMKGPYERLKYDLRRVFECPRCHRRVRVPGSVTVHYCNCSGPDKPPTCMKLVQDGIRRVDSRNSTALPADGRNRTGP